MYNSNCEHKWKMFGRQSITTWGATLRAPHNITLTARKANHGLPDKVDVLHCTNILVLIVSHASSSEKIITVVKAFDKTLKHKKCCLRFACEYKYAILPHESILQDHVRLSTWPANHISNADSRLQTALCFCCSFWSKKAWSIHSLTEVLV